MVVFANSLPALVNSKITRAEKIAHYGSIDRWVISFTGVVDNDITSPSEDDIENLDIVEYGKMDLTKHAKMLSNVGIAGDNFPVKLSYYDIFTPKIAVLKGEETVRPFEYSVINKSTKVGTKILEEKEKLMIAFYEQVFMVAATKAAKQVEGNHVEFPPNAIIDPEVPTIQGENGKPLRSVKEIEDYVGLSSSDISEIEGSQLLEMILEQTDFFSKAINGLYHIIACDKEVYHTTKINDKVYTRLVNLRNFHYKLPKDEDDISKSIYTKETKEMSLQEVIDTFYEHLSEDDYNYLTGKTFNPTLSVYPSAISVTRYEFKAPKKIGILKTYSSEGLVIKKIVDEEYVVDKKLGEEIKWFWRTERYSVTRLGDDCYIDIKPMTPSYTNVDSLLNDYSSYTGYIGKYSITQLVKHYLFLYATNMYNLHMALMRAKGAGITMDIAQLPNKKGWNVEKWFHYLTVHGISFIDSSQTGEDGQRSTYNQFSSFDLSLSNSIISNLNILDMIENTVQDLINISNQRLGAVQNRETVGGVQRSISQSSLATEHIFIPHNIAKRRTMQHLMNVGKTLYDCDEVITTTVSGNGIRKTSKISPKNYKYENLNVFVSNSIKAHQSLTKLKADLEALWKVGQLKLKDYIAITETSSMAEAKYLAIQADDAKTQEIQDQRKAEAEQAQADRELKLKELEQKEVERTEKQNLEKYKIDENNDTQRDVARINAAGRIQMGQEKQVFDANNNNIPDVLEEKYYQLDSDKARLAREKLELDKKKQEDDARLKEKALNIQKAKQSNTSN